MNNSNKSRETHETVSTKCDEKKNFVDMEIDFFELGFEHTLSVDIGKFEFWNKLILKFYQFSWISA